MAKKELSQIRVSSSSSASASTASASSEAFSSLALTLDEATVTALELPSEALAILGDLSWLFCKEDKSPGFRC